MRYMQNVSLHDRIWRYVLIVSVLIATIIGVGMFGLPYAAQKAGIGVALIYLLIFGIITTIVHLFYFEVVMATPGRHRLTGYARLYLGKHWAGVTFIQEVVSLWGTLLIYTILTGKFLSLLAEYLLHFSFGHSEFLWGAIFFIISAAVVLKGSRAVGKQEFWFSLPLIFLVLLLFYLALTSSSFSLEILFSPHLSDWIAPYGITLFALSGFSVIPSLKEIIEPVQKRGERVIIPLIVSLGTLIPALLYALFIIGVVGVSKQATSLDALSGLTPFLGNTIVLVGAALGIVAIYTSFLPVADELYETFINDYRKKKAIAALFTFAPPFFLYLFHVFDFELLITITGAIMGGYVGVLVIKLFWRLEKRGETNLNLSHAFSKIIGWSIIALFIFASCYVIADTLMFLK